MDIASYLATPPQSSPPSPAATEQPEDGLDRLMSSVEELHPADPYINRVIGETLSEACFSTLPGPLATFVFAGVPFSGKTLVARKLATLLGGTDKALYVLEAGSPRETAWSASPTLQVAASENHPFSAGDGKPSFVGTSDLFAFLETQPEKTAQPAYFSQNDTTGLDPLVEHLDLHPSGVILIRHLERASETFTFWLKNALQNSFLRCRSSGDKVSLAQTVVIIETRFGTSLLARTARQKRTTAEHEREIDRYIQDKVGKSIINRVDRVVPFRKRLEEDI